MQPSLPVTGGWLAVTRRHRMGFPVFRSISSSIHADAITPTEPSGVVAVSPDGNGLPLKRARSASATSLSEACSAFTHVSAYLVVRSPRGDFYTEYFNEFVTSFVALVTSGRATDWPGGFRTHWRSPAFTAYTFSGILNDKLSC